MSFRSPSCRMLTSLLGLAVAVTGLTMTSTQAQAAQVTTSPAARKVVSTKIVPANFLAAPSSDSNGYAWISYYRKLAGLSPVTRSAKLEAQDALHVRYLANFSLACETNVHDELTSRVAGCGANPRATAAGKAAANNSDVTRVNVRVTDRQAVSNWFGAAFHALTLLDPRLQSTGYAAYYTASPAGARPLAWPFTAAANVYSGRTGTYRRSVIAFPASGSSTPLLSYQLGTESPEPFRDAKPTACAGWSAKTTVSAPIIVQWPKAGGVAKGSAQITDLTTGARQATCELTGSSYPSGSLPAQFLDGANGITKSGFFYAATPFVVGHKYQLRVGGRVQTTFTATSVQATPSVSVRPASTPGSVKLAYRAVGSDRKLTQIWSGSRCTGRLISQSWTGAPAETVSGLTSRRAYSARVAGASSSGSIRWSGCLNFRAA